MVSALRQWLLPPTFDSEEANRTAQILNIILLIFLFVSLFIPIFTYFADSNPDSEGKRVAQVVSIVMGLIMAVIIWIVRRQMFRGRIRLAGWITTCIIWLGVTITIFQFYGVQDSTVPAYALVIAVPALILRERKAVIVFTGLTIAALIGAYMAELAGLIVFIPQPTDLNDVMIAVIIFVMLGLILTYAIQTLNSALERAETGEQAAAQANMQLQGLNADLENRVAARTQALTTSAEIGRSISTILERDRLVSAVADQIREAFDYYQTHVYLLDETGQTLNLVAGAGHAGNELVDRHHFVPVNKGLVGRAVRTNEPVLAPDVSQMEAWLPNPSLPGTQSELVVPISLGNQVMGVLDIQHHVRHGLGTNDRDLLLSISGQVAIALQNARLLAEAQARAEQEALINQIGQQIQSTTTIEQALQIAVREVGRVVKAPQVRVRLETSSLNLSDQPGNGRDQQLEAANQPA